MERPQASRAVHQERTPDQHARVLRWQMSGVEGALFGWQECRPHLGKCLVGGQEFLIPHSQVLDRLRVCSREHQEL